MDQGRRTGRTTQALERCIKKVESGYDVFYCVPHASLRNYVNDIISQLRPNTAASINKTVYTFRPVLRGIPEPNRLTILSSIDLSHIDMKTRGLSRYYVERDHYWDEVFFEMLYRLDEARIPNDGE